VRNAPLQALDSFGLELTVLPKEYFSAITLEVYFAEGYVLGHMRLSYPTGVGIWADDGPWIETVKSIDVPPAVCSDCKLHIASCTIKRKVVAWAKIEISPVEASVEYPESIFGVWIQRLNSLVEWEEAAHLASAQRWLRDHQKTGYGLDCDKTAAEWSAIRMADALVRLHETAVYGSYVAENVAIDLIGMQLKYYIHENIFALKDGQ
jgi:hypothetical protein